MGEDVDMSSVAGGQPGATGAGQFAEYGGINPDLEPELAMALKVSLEEEAARLKKTEDQPPQTTNTPVDQPMQEQEEEFDEEYYLQ